MAVNKVPQRSFVFLCTICFQPKACSEAALSLMTCMEETKCVKLEGKSVYECLKTSDERDEEDDCKAQRNAYYLCKHSQLNMRTRIRGTRTY